MRFCLLALSILASAPPTRAEDRPIVLRVNSFLYADNAEFIGNPYRDGETLMGGQIRVQLGLPVGARTRLWLGAVTDSRWGSERAFETKKPVIALEISGERDTFVLGTLRSGQLGRKSWQGLWPDRSGPHDLIPPLEVDTLTMTRPYEAGMQWLRSGTNWKQDTWISWQQLNTAEHRERFDVGTLHRVRVYGDEAEGIFVLGQAHIVHEGGQLYHAGAVGDSIAGGPGVEFISPAFGGYMSATVMAVFSKHNPNRENQGRFDRLNGHGGFVRLVHGRGGWRFAILGWASKNFIKWEGDPNYGSLGDADGDSFFAIYANRSYEEVSVSRMFELAMNAHLIANTRLYWIDGDFDYSYRVAVAVNMNRVIRR